MISADVRYFVCYDCQFISLPLFAGPRYVSEAFSALIRQHEGHSWHEILPEELEKTKEMIASHAS